MKVLNRCNFVEINKVWGGRVGLIPLSDKNEESGTSRELWDPLKQNWESFKKRQL